MENQEKLTIRQQKALETRNILFETAVRLILERGFDHVHINDITREAGTSTGSFYTYFKTKEQIIVEHYKQIDAVYLDAYQKLNQNLSSTEKLIEVLKAGFTFSEDLGREFMGIFFSNQFAQKEDIPYVMDNDRIIYKIIYETIDEGQKSGEFRTDLDLLDLISMVFKCYTGSYFEWNLMKDNRSLTEEGVKFLYLFIEGTIKTKN
ncbi:TetR/AcrR family transcriptional regulator [Halalkalibacter nanhaiisediminis]|uniref:TetR family transcriptional regulator n=1 Tax=Halalkalibacter nanhaiisediminis TaxID=688079 RepID=A0A562QFB7_9BACI|nr:TetR/AcrR family transcriptional regulator [Halalkalibacter nanhaiisediminis]TWI54726.1 TetR family transcriptional regulator [Halalkalibacter nanhaiisediminis]